MVVMDQSLGGLTPDEALQVYLGLFSLALETLLKKRVDYSGDEDPFANMRKSVDLGVEPVIGVLVRDMDKSQRIAQLMTQVKGDLLGHAQESVIDNLADKLNYTGIAAGFISEEAPEMKWLLIQKAWNLVPQLQEIFSSLD